MAGFRDATFFTTLAINAFTVLSLFVAFYVLLIISKVLAAKTVIIRSAQYIRIEY